MDNNRSEGNPFEQEIEEYIPRPLDWILENLPNSESNEIRNNPFHF
jgi:hypothetical protein